MLALPTAALAQLRDDSVRIDAGWFLNSSDATLRVDGSRAGSRIDLQGDLALSKRDDTYAFGAEWRFAMRHRLSVRYFEIDRSGTATLDEDETIGDVTFPAGSSVDSSFKNRVVPLAYSYSFYRSPDTEFAGTIGLHWTRLELNVRGRSNTNVTVIDKEASADVAGPLPLLGLRLDYAFTPKWRVLTHAEYFALKVGGSVVYKGSMASLRAATEYDVFRNVTLGLSYTYFRMNVDADDSDWHGAIDYRYYGPMLYFAAMF